MPMTLELENYRTLRRSAWAPSGVCAIAGPNGSGKTTLLAAPAFLRSAYARTVPEAIGFVGGNWGLRSFDAPPEEPVRLVYRVEQTSWELELATSGAGVDERPGETVRVGAEVVLRRVPFADHFTFRGREMPCGENTCLRVAFESSRDADFERLVASLNGYRFYERYHLSTLRRQGSQASGETYLHATGANVFTVLRNWRDRRESRRQYQFVTDTLRRAFPDLFTGFEFNAIGLTVTASFYHPRYPEEVPIHAAPDGLLVGLLHLTAVAGCPPGGVVAIDEMENSLHPFAIRTIIEAFREWVGERDATVAVATHSPVVLDDLDNDDDRARVFVMQPDRPSRPSRLTDLADRTWLRQFSAGRLYVQGDVGGPIVPGDGDA